MVHASHAHASLHVSRQQLPHAADQSVSILCFEDASEDLTDNAYKISENADFEGNHSFNAVLGYTSSGFVVKTLHLHAIPFANAL